MKTKKPEKTVKIKVSGIVEMSKENWDCLLAYDNIHQAITYALHCQYVNTERLDYERIG
jgi:hypothetical protein